MQEGPDDIIVDDLEDEDYLEDSNKGRRVFFLRLLALVVALSFTIMVISNVLSLISLPSLSFLLQSRELLKDPQIKEWREAVVAVKAQDRRGTGFNIDSKGLIITNNHILEKSKHIQVDFSHLKSHKVEDWIQFPEIDLAIIRLDGENLPTLTLENQTVLTVGDDVIIIGNPLGFFRVASKAHFIGYTRLRSWDTSVLMIKGPINKGSSGSPVINEDGNVVGIIFATLTPQQKDPNEIIGLALPVEEILKHIE